MEPIANLNVITSQKEPIEVKTPMAGRNRDFLLKKAEEISQGLYPEQLKASSLLDWLPGSKSIGSALGYALGKTHGQQISNFFVGIIARRVIGKPETPHSLWGNLCSNVVMPSFEESAKLLVTPSILPFIEVACLSAGGITVPAAAMLVNMLVQRIIKDENSKYTLDNLPPLEELVTVENGEMIDANGNALHPDDIQELKDVVLQYNLLCQLMVANREDVDDIIREHLLTDEKGEPCFCNGENLSQKQQDIIEKAVSALKRENFVGNFNDNNKYIEKMVRLLTSKGAPLKIS